MTVTIELKPEIEARVKSEAASLGLPVEDYLESVIESQLANGEGNHPPKIPRQQIGRGHGKHGQQVIVSTLPLSSMTAARRSMGMMGDSGLSSRYKHSSSEC